MTSKVSQSEAKRNRAAHGLLLLALMTLPLALPQIAAWPWGVLLPLLVYGVVVVALPALRSSVGWCRLGRVDRATLRITGEIVLASSFALVLWYLLLHPNLQSFAQRVPTREPLWLLLVGAAVATLNAFMEEAIWRGVLLDALDARIGPKGAVWVQAIAFGAAHTGGIPQGALGVCMASVYGLMLGRLRQEAQGLLLCFAAHFCADATIFILVFWGR